jgi:hypothetical protein
VEETEVPGEYHQHCSNLVWAEKILPVYKKKRAPKLINVFFTLRLM